MSPAERYYGTDQNNLCMVDYKIDALLQTAATLVSYFSALAKLLSDYLSVCDRNRNPPTLQTDRRHAIAIPCYARTCFARVNKAMRL